MLKAPTRSLLVLAGALGLLASSASAGPWLVPPGTFSTFYGPNGPDGIPGTLDDVPGLFLGIVSGYAGGSYVGPAGAVLTANVSMTSEVFPAGANFLYIWTITNTGTGPMVTYFDTGNGPNFLLDPEGNGGLFGTAGVDRIPGTADDLVPETEVDLRVGGPPVIGLWGGTWNPSTGTEVPRLEPIPEPATLLLLGSGLAGLLFRPRGKSVV